MGLRIGGTSVIPVTRPVSGAESDVGSTIWLIGHIVKQDTFMLTWIINSCKSKNLRPVRLDFSNCGYVIYPARGGSPSVGVSFPKDAKPCLIAQGRQHALEISYGKAPGESLGWSLYRSLPAPKL